MSRIIAGLAAAFMVAQAPPLAAAQSPPSVQTADEHAALRQAAERGALIYAYDQAAWHGTDDMFAKVENPAEIVGGWIVDGPADAPELVFFDKNEADPQAVYVAQFRDNRLVSSRVLGSGDDRSLSTKRNRMIAARKAALEALLASGMKQCVDRPFNTVVLPPLSPNGPTLVYFLTPQTENDAIPLGGHYLVEVSPAGKAGPPRRFTNTCIDLPTKSQSAEPVALGISHLLDSVPTEIHVFSSLAAHLPVAVGTEDGRIWMVEGNEIRLLNSSKHD